MNRYMADPQEQRSNFRIAPPSHLVKEIAVWFMQAAEGHILRTEELGPPHLCSLNATGGVRLENVSGGGLCFSLSREDLHCCPQMREQHCYVYLKLRHVMPGKHQQTCLFLGMHLLHAAARNGRVQVRGKIMTKGSAQSVRKAFQLLHVQKVGVRELVVWCEEINRMGRGILPPVSPGLDLEYLLMELNSSQQQWQYA